MRVSVILFSDQKSDNRINNTECDKNNTDNIIYWNKRACSTVNVKHTFHDTADCESCNSGVKRITAQGSRIIVFLQKSNYTERQNTEKQRDKKREHHIKRDHSVTEYLIDRTEDKHEYCHGEIYFKAFTGAFQLICIRCKQCHSRSFPRTYRRKSWVYSRLFR